MAAQNTAPASGGAPSTLKRVPAEVNKRRNTLLPLALALLLVPIPFLQTKIDPTAKLYRGDTELLINGGSGLGNEFLLLPLLGFREAAAGLLWVRCDEFFHSGDYDAILPLVRLITWLDPHADNIYITGAWHLSYNFTDSYERSDRRYLNPSQALLQEGIRNNMNIPDIKFEAGWQNYDKIKDYVAAQKYFQMAIEGEKGDGKTTDKESQDYPYAAPLKTHHILAHTYAKQGRIPECIAEWDKAFARSAEMLKLKPDDFSTKQLQQAEMRNRSQQIQRWKDRYTAEGHSAINPTKYPFVLVPPASSPDKTPRPWDVSFEPKVEVVRPKVFRVYGKFSSAGDGGRVDVKILDADYKERPINPDPKLNTFQVDDSETILQDAISIRKSKFEREIDMSKDPKMYSFSKDKYRIILSFNTRATSPHLQDRFGWSGEGLTDHNPQNIYYDRRPALLGTKLIEGQGGDGPVWDGSTVSWPQHGQPPRVIRVVFEVTKDQVMGNKPITDKDRISPP